jgi:hypothetical protein
MKREADLIDVWFDSGYAICTMALSFENKDKIDENDFRLISLLKVWIKLVDGLYATCDCDFGFLIK